MCIVFCPSSPDHHELSGPDPLSHLGSMVQAVVHDSLRKICRYQQNVPQHYYLLDTLV